MSSSDSLSDQAIEQAPDVLNVEEVAKYLRIPRSSIYKMAKRRAIPCQKVGRQWRFSRKAIDNWLANVGGAE